MFNSRFQKALQCLFTFLLVFLSFAAIAIADDVSKDSGGDKAKGSTKCEWNECPASVAEPTAAAFATEGYWLMGYIVNELIFSKLNVLAPLLYCVAAFAGLFMMAMGQPPRTYLWFMFGPAIYNWLLAPDQAVKGVNWVVAGERQPMQQVWQRAEVGLLNNSGVVNNPGITISANNGPSGTINLPYPFVWYDEVVSGVTQELQKFVGVYRQNEGTGSDNNTNKKPTGGTDTERAWHLLTNSKWAMLENVTAATMHNANLREAFVVFLSSECGDILNRHIDKGAYASAAYSKGLDLPASVIRQPDGDPNRDPSDFKALSDELAQQLIPVPRALIELSKENPQDTTATKGTPEIRTFEDSNFFMPDPDGEYGLNLDEWKHVTCQMLLELSVHGMRWEAGHAFNHFIREAADHGVRKQEVMYDFLYGWDFVEPLDEQKQEQFIINLILVHIFRNEMVMAPSPVNPRWSPAERSSQYAETYTRTVGSKSKYGELYTWAQLMPYVQGTTLYLITIAYPFCVVLIVLPGWHKIMFTWMGFFAWVKSWDLGFAIVASMERSIWAMLGHNEYQRVLNDRIIDIHEVTNSRVDVNCPAPHTNEFGCPVANVDSFPQDVLWDDVMYIFNEMMVMAPHLDLDLRNGYYVYIMSALYFAVPAVTGQIFLGAKAGAANMLSGMTQGASAAGEKSAAGFTSELTTRGKNNEGTIGQEAFKKSLRSTGLANQALNAGNNALDQGRLAGEAGQVSQALGQQMAARGASLQGSQANMAYAAAGFSLASGLVGDAAGTIGGLFGARSAGGAPPAGSPPSGNTPSGNAPTGEGGALANFSNRGYQAGQLVSAAANAHAQHAVNQANARDRGAQVDRGIAQFGNQARQSGYQESANRLNQAGQHEAMEAKWRAMRNWGNQVSGKAAAMGVFAGTFSAGAKSESMYGFANEGQLDTGREAERKDKASSLFGFSSGQYMDNVNQSQGYLRDNYGSGSGRYDYAPMSAAGMFNTGIQGIRNDGTGMLNASGGQAFIDALSGNSGGAQDIRDGRYGQGGGLADTMANPSGRDPFVRNDGS